MENLTNVTTGKVRLSFVHLFKPFAFQPGQEEKFSCTILVPKSDMDTMGRINAAIEAAKSRGISDKWGGVHPPMIPTPVYDGDGVRPSDGMAFGPECKGCWVFTASAKADYPPEIVDTQVSPIINQSEIYSGIYARVNVNFYPYAFGGKKGIGCGLGSVQKVSDGEALGGSAPTAAQAFGAGQSAPQNAQPTYQTPTYQGQPYQAQGFMNAPQGMPQGQGMPQARINPITGLPM